jgi:HK97 family phage portal protein
MLATMRRRGVLQRIGDAVRAARASYSSSDPELLHHLGIASPIYAGVEVTEATALGLSAVYRAVMMISQSLALLPWETVDSGPDGRMVIPSWLDTPGGPVGPTAFELKETGLIHNLLHGDTFFLHRYTQANALYALEPLHPLTVGVDRWLPRMSSIPRPPGDRLYTVTLDDGGTEVLTSRYITHIPGPSVDGLRGISPITAGRQSLGTTIAGDRAAAKTFGNGALINVLVTSDDDMEPEEADKIQDDLNANISGWEHAAAARVINRRLKVSPLSMSSADAQFLQSREFQIEEIARWYGIPPFQLMQTTKQTSWGTGIDVQQEGLSRSVLAPWAVRFEQRLSRLLRNPKRIEVNFDRLERPNVEAEDAMLLARVAAGVLTKEEYRAMRGYGPLPQNALPPAGGGPDGGSQ